MSAQPSCAPSIHITGLGKHSDMPSLIVAASEKQGPVNLGSPIRLVTSIAAYVSAKGTQIEGSGITPDTSTPWSCEEAAAGIRPMNGPVPTRCISVSPANPRAAPALRLVPSKASVQNRLDRKGPGEHEEHDREEERNHDEADG